ncbi:MAG: hypothetical protein P1U89_20265 [Verrucomicrobiales bacterium]|nr:hypothetical protein [Verrucomicrobiales bacterium]
MIKRPVPNLSNLSPIDASLLVTVLVGSRKNKTSKSEILRKLRTLNSEIDELAIEEAIQRRQIVASGTLFSITDSGVRSLNSMLPESISKLDWSKDLVGQFLPLMALGFDPKQMKAFRQRRDQAKLEAVTIVKLFGFQCGPIEKVTIHQARAAYLWSILTERFSDFDLRASGKVDSIKDEFSKRIFCSVIGSKQNRLDLATKALACGAVGANTNSLDALKSGLIQRASKIAEEGADKGPIKSEGEKELAKFALQVKEIARELRTPPFDDSVSISQVYDAYGKKFPDAGKLSEFKSRLISARQNGLLSLMRLDSPRLVDKDVRDRSELIYDQTKVHLVGKK